ncbi:MAG: prolipoprotein diacylglyceryl transferase [Bacteroidota bacterium]
MNMLGLASVIHWNPPIGIPIGSFTLRFYGLLFATAFAVAFQLIRWVIRRENQPPQWLDPLLIYSVIGAIVGARLGHVFFYGWEYYQEFWWEIPLIWKGGLASHGGGIGLFLAWWLFSKRVSKKSILWLGDRIVMGVSVGGGLIRIGNLMNQEIVGAPTEVPWGFIFYGYGGDPMPIPRHPAQLYEAFAYFLIFGLLLFLYRKDFAQRYQGFLSGLYLVLTFLARFLLETVKENQEAFENDMIFNMGQWLSIPMMLAGLGLIIWGLTHRPPQAAAPPAKQA